MLNGTTPEIQHRKWGPNVIALTNKLQQNKSHSDWSKNNELLELLFLGNFVKICVEYLTCYVISLTGLKN